VNTGKRAGTEYGITGVSGRDPPEVRVRQAVAEAGPIGGAGRPTACTFATGGAPILVWEPPGSTTSLGARG
jgi:hypothetical protein